MLKQTEDRGGADHVGAVERAVAHAPGRRGRVRPPGDDWHTVGNEDEAFYLRVYGTGEYRYKGADMGVVVARGRMQTDDRELTERAKRWATGITSLFAGTAADELPPRPEPVYTKWF